MIARTPSEEPTQGERNQKALVKMHSTKFADESETSPKVTQGYKKNGNGTLHCQVV